MRFLPQAIVLLGGALAGLTAATAQTVLPPGEGHDLVARVCSGCHDPAIVTQQRLSPDGWRELVETMAARGAPGTDAELNQITTYLAKNFPPDHK